LTFSAHDRVSAEIASFCDAFLPVDCFASCIAHGARGWRTASKLKQLGTTPGIPDWLVIYRGKPYFAEIKTGKGSMSEAQRRTKARTELAGAHTVTVHSLEDFVFALGYWRIPILDRARGDVGLPDDEVGL